MVYQVMKISYNRLTFRVFFLLFPLLFPGYLFSYAQAGREFRPEIKLFRIGTDTLIFHSEIRQDKFYNSVFPFRSKDLYFEIDTAFQPAGAIYEYSLEGLSRRLETPMYYPVKEYTNLAPGKYVFNVRITVENQTKEILNYAFVILPPFYRTRVALLCYLIFIAVLFWAIKRSRDYQFAKQRYQLEKLINERTFELLKEKDRTEDLLANVLPKGTADEIKSTGRAQKKKYSMVTVLFSDIQGFTKIAESMNPEVLIDELDKFFFHFDSVAEKYNIEKIKTIGDAYMCAGGIPDKNRTNPVEVVLAALEMQQYMAQLKKELANKHKQVWDVRIGIHTGPVVAGVVGHKKLSYDIWGDTVNTASRMESSGEAGRINISGSTYELVKDFFICEYRGKMPVKYKGEIDMYFVNGIRPELSDGNLANPGKQFFIKLQLLRLQDLEDYIVEILEKELPDGNDFHNSKHTIHVSTMVELIGRAEGITDEEMLLLRTAALLHDIGYVSEKDNHVEASCDYALDILPKFRYDKDQIDKICSLIRATQNPYSPKDLLQKIICDANYNFLGRVDFENVAKRMWYEAQRKEPGLSFQQWKKNLKSLIERYEFHTDTARRLRDVQKKDLLLIIQNLKQTNKNE